MQDLQMSDCGCDLGKAILEIASKKEDPGKWDNAPFQVYYKLGNTQKGDSVEEALVKVLTSQDYLVMDKPKAKGKKNPSRLGIDITVIGKTSKWTKGPFQEYKKN